jgi:uncharacterized membrane protein YdbT with pleckstrin-like domain
VYGDTFEQVSISQRAFILRRPEKFLPQLKEVDHMATSKKKSMNPSTGKPATAKQVAQIAAAAAAATSKDNRKQHKQTQAVIAAAAVETAKNSKKQHKATRAVVTAAAVENAKATKAEGKKSRAVTTAAATEVTKAVREEGEDTRSMLGTLLARIGGGVPTWLTILLIVLAIVAGIIVGLNINASLLAEVTNVIDKATGTVLYTEPKYSAFVCGLISVLVGAAASWVLYIIAQAIAAFAYRVARR